MTTSNGADNIQLLKTDIEVSKALIYANIDLLIERDIESGQQFVDDVKAINMLVNKLAKTIIDLKYAERGWK